MTIVWPLTCPCFHTCLSEVKPPPNLSAKGSSNPILKSPIYHQPKSFFFVVSISLKVWGNAPVPRDYYTRINLPEDHVPLWHWYGEEASRPFYVATWVQLKFRFSHRNAIFYQFLPDCSWVIFRNNFHRHMRYLFTNICLVQQRWLKKKGVKIDCVASFSQAR